MVTKALSPAWNRFTLCLLFSIAISFAFPPFQLGFLAYWAFIPVFFLFEELSLKGALIWGYVSGFFWNLATLYWIGWVTLIGMIGAILVLPIYMMVYAWIHVLSRQRFGNAHIFLMPFVWVAIEFIKSLGSLGFPWTSLAYTQTYYTDFIQYASITGAYGVSFWVFWINVIIYVLIKYRYSLKKVVLLIVILILMFVLPFVYAKLSVPKMDRFKEKLRVVLIQGNIDPYLKWDERFIHKNIAIYDSLTRETKSLNPQLVVWPETATACYLRARTDYLIQIQNLTRTLDAPILTGSPDYEYHAGGEYTAYNALLLLQPGTNQIQSYWKMHLVPFGERVPFEDVIPFFQDFVESLELGTGDFTPGNKPNIFEVDQKNGTFPVAGVICFESVFPDLVRRLIKMGGEILVIVTNDAWFGNTSGPYQHARIAVFRAIENRVSIARCANTGISSFIDPYGRILKKTKFQKQTYIHESIPLRNEETFYTQYGDIFSYVMLGISGIGLMMALTRRS